MSTPWLWEWNKLQALRNPLFHNLCSEERTEIDSLKLFISSDSLGSHLIKIDSNFYGGILMHNPSKSIPDLHLGEEG